MEHVMELSERTGVLIGNRAYCRLWNLTKAKKTERLCSCAGG